MIEKIYERARGMAMVSQRAFAQMREPDFGAAWNDATLDPFALLEDGLACVVGGVIRTAETDPREVRALDGLTRYATESAGFGRMTASQTPPLTRQNAAEGAQSRLAYSEEEEPARAPARHLAENIHFEQPERGPSHPGSSRAKPLTTLQEGLRAARQLTGDVPVFHRSGSFVPPRFTYGERKIETNRDLHAEASIAPAQFGSSPRENQRISVATDLWAPIPHGKDRLTSYKPPSAATDSLLPSVERPNSRLVETSALVHLLNKNAPPAGDVRAHSSAPVIRADAEYPTPAHPAEGSARTAVTVEGVLEELEDRLRFEFLRTYGSSGE